jgi:hypothetical protein
MQGRFHPTVESSPSEEPGPVRPPGGFVRSVLTLASGTAVRRLRLELGERGRRRIEEDFDVTRVADELTRRFA